MTIQQPRWVLLAALALLAAAPRAAHAQSAQPGSEWTTPVYHPPPAPAGPPSPAPPAQPAPPQPGYAPGYGPPPNASPGYGPPAYAPPAPPPPPEPVHAGFFLRLHIGPGFSSYSGSGGTTGTTQLSGSGISLGLALGGALAPNFAVYGTFFETVMTGGHLSTNRTDLAAADSAGVGGFGAGAIYYFEPINLYVSGTLALTAVVVDDAKGKMLMGTDGGIGFQGMVGKEWWVSEHWGLGAAAEIVAGTSMKDQNDGSVHWTAEAFNVVFSASYF